MIIKHYIYIYYYYYYCYTFCCPNY